MEKKLFPSNRLKDFIWCLSPYSTGTLTDFHIFFARLPDRISMFTASKSRLFDFDKLLHACPFKTNREETAASRVGGIFCYQSEEQLLHEMAGNQLKVCFHSH